MELKEECSQITRNRHIICQENRRKVIFTNNQRKTVIKVFIDGCQITDGLRCDYLVIYEDYQNFIELKGKNLKHAFSQLKRTISILGLSNYKINSFLITSRCPLSSAEIQNQKLIFLRKYSSTLIIKNTSHIIEI